MIAQGPVASQVAIKQLGTNGGGFFNANSAHPFENPTPLSNFLEMSVHPSDLRPGLVYTFGKMVSDTRQGWAIFAAMSLLFLAGVFVCYPAEQAGNPILAKLGIADGRHRQRSPAATWRARKCASASRPPRCGPWSRPMPVTAASTACTTATRRSAGWCPLFNIQTGEVIFGGVGAGLYGMLLFAILAVFIAGLMVGRTPEYLGKKIEQKEVKMAMLALIACAASILVFHRRSVRSSISRRTATGIRPDRRPPT